MNLPDNPYQDCYWTSSDDLKLHYRDYPGDTGRPPILCLHALTRNARDYDRIARRLMGDWRLIVPDFRGRGKSAYAADSSTYNPITYCADILGLIDELGLRRVIVFGTSLGGLVTMLLAASRPGLIAGALVNDVGPEIDPAGLARIKTFVGRQASWPTWMHAARAVQELNADIHPGFGPDDWLAMAKRLYRLNSAGRIVLDYDMKIADPLRVPGGETAPDMWNMLDGLRDVPTLIVRGERSDLLSAATAGRMADTLRRAELVTVAQTGHCPTLDEPELQSAIERLLARATEPAPA